MILRKVKLKNFISHAESELEFNLGVTVLVGPNGAGKTSILDAIVFGLFGERVRGDKVEDLIRRGCSSAEIEVEFEQDAKNYIVKLLRKKRGLEAILERKDFGTIANTATEVQKEIEKIIGLDRETALKSIIVRQGEIASLIEADPRDRKKLLGKLIGIENLERSWEKMKDLIDHFKNMARNYDEVKTKTEMKERRRSEEKEKIKTLESELENLKFELEREKKEFDEANERLRQLKEKRDRHERLSRELSGLETQMGLMKSSLRDLEIRYERAIKALQEAEILRRDVEKIPIIERLLEIKNNIENREIVRKERTKELKRILELKRELDETRKAYEEYTGLEKEISELKIRIDELSKLQITKAEIDTKIKSLKDEIGRYLDELERIRKEAVKYLPEVSAEAKNRVLTEVQREKEELEKKLSRLEQEKGSLRGRKREIEEYMDILGESNVCPVCKNVLTPEHREKVKQDFQNEKQQILLILSTIEKEIKDLIGKKNELDTKIRDLQKLDIERAERIQMEVKQKCAEIQDLRKIDGEILPKLSELENYNKLLEKALDKQRDLKKDYERHLSAKRGLERERNEEEVRNEISEIEKEIKTLEKEFEDLMVKAGSPKDLQNEYRRLRGVKQKYDELSAIARDAEKLEKDKLTLETEIEKLKAQINSLIGEIKDLGFKKEELDKFEMICQEKSRKITEISTKIEEKKKLLDQGMNILESLEKEIEELKKQLDKLDRVINFIKDLEKIRAAFSRDGVQRLLRSLASPVISENARKYVEKFNLDITDIVVSEDFDISVIKGGEELPLSSLSGGERVAVAIALRLAIARAISGKISTIIMDEPTTHLDEERRKELLEILKNFFREGGSIPQMIIITHHRELEEVADTIYEVEKVDGISRVSFVSSVS